MSMRDQYDNLDKYAAYDYKDVSNAYGHGEDDAIDKVLEIIDRSTAYAKELDEIQAGKVDGMLAATSAIRKAVLALKGGEQE